MKSRSVPFGSGVAGVFHDDVNNAGGFSVPHVVVTSKNASLKHLNGTSAMRHTDIVV